MKQESAELLSAPLKIFISSDGNELAFEREHKGIIYYKYTKSLTKLGSILPVTREQLHRLLKNNKSIAAPPEQEKLKEVAKPAVKFLSNSELPPLPPPVTPVLKSKTKQKINKQINLFS